jgi:acetyltransferase-like isoleucine patch superfamily enzyme
MWGFEIGTGAKLYGWPILFRNYGARVIIGKNLTLRSSPRSNFIGVNRPCYICAVKKDASVTIGDECGFTSTVISAWSSIHIGNRVLCGANTTITDSDWHHADPERRADSEGVPCAPVVIEDNVWLGMNCIVLKGVRIGRDTVVAAGSIVTDNLPPGVIASGVPAKVRRTIDSKENADAVRTLDNNTTGTNSLL